MLLIVTGKVLGRVACSAGCGLAILVCKSGVVATVNVRAAVGEPTLPAGSVAVAVTLCGPSVMTAAGEQPQLPALSATAVQTVLAPSFTTTVLPGSAVPLKSGVLSLMVLLAAGVVSTGTAGGVVSTVTVTGVLAGLTPLALPATALTVWLPTDIGAAGAQLHRLPALAVAVQITVPVGDSVMVIRAPGVPMPLKVGWVAVTALPLVGLLMVGATGGMGAATTATLGVMLVGLLLAVLVSPAVGKTVPLNGPGVVPTVLALAVTGTWIALLPLAGMGVLLTQVTIWPAVVQFHVPLVKLAGALVPAGRVMVVVTGPVVGRVPTLVTVMGTLLAVPATKAGAG